MMVVKEAVSEFNLNDRDLVYRGYTDGVPRLTRRSSGIERERKERDQGRENGRTRQTHVLSSTSQGPRTDVFSDGPRETVSVAILRGIRS